MRTIPFASTALSTHAHATRSRGNRSLVGFIVAAVLMIVPAAMLASPPVHAQGAGMRAAVPAGPPPDWARTKTQLRELQLAGENDKAIAIVERIVIAHPRFADGHFWLGAAHESAARVLVRTNGARARRHFDLAATHLRQAFELGGGEYPDATIRGLIDLYEYALPSAERWKATIVDALARYPAEPAAHWYGVRLILREGRITDLDAAFRNARAALPAAADRRLEYASLLVGLAGEHGQPARAALAREALALADEAVKKNPADRIVREAADAIKEDVARLPRK